MDITYWTNALLPFLGVVVTIISFLYLVIRNSKKDTAEKLDKISTKLDKLSTDIIAESRDFHGRLCALEAKCKKTG